MGLEQAIKLPPDFRVIAHRGASAYAPENSLAAFLKARDLKASELETDVRLSADGEVVLCHDSNLERFGHPDITLEETPWSVLKELDAGSWFGSFADERFLLLSELLERFEESFVYHIDIKGCSPGLAEAAYEICKRSRLLQCCLFTSFQLESLRRLQELDPALKLSWLVGEVSPEIIETGSQANVGGLCVPVRLATRELMQALRTRFSLVRAWDLNGTKAEVQQKALQLAQFGYEGVTVDWPDWLLEIQNL